MKLNKIILAFDSFKGSLTAEEAVTAATEAVRETHGDIEVIGLPLADGGEGTTEALRQFMNAELVFASVHDPLLRSIKAQYAVSKDGSTAIMEMAAASGLILLAPEERNPMETSTYGVGEMILDAVGRGCRHIVIGIGGSATNDGGLGMLAALGAEIRIGDDIVKTPCGKDLMRVTSVSLESVPDISIEVICDVNNPLFGPEGAAYVFAGQKGADAGQIALLDSGLRNLSGVCRLNPDLPGNGAAGGLGYALRLIGASIRPGSEAIIDLSGLDGHLDGADLVITGEGSIDAQTLRGKLPSGVMQCAARHGVYTIAVAGKVKDRERLLNAGFKDAIQITPEGMPLETAMKKEIAMANLKNAVRDMLK